MIHKPDYDTAARTAAAPGGGLAERRIVTCCLWYSFYINGSEVSTTTHSSFPKPKSSTNTSPFCKWPISAAPVSIAVSTFAEIWTVPVAVGNPGTENQPLGRP